MYLGQVTCRIFKVILKKQNTEVVLSQEQSSVKTYVNKSCPFVMSLKINRKRKKRKNSDSICFQQESDRPSLPLPEKLQAALAFRELEGQSFSELLNQHKSWWSEKNQSETLQASWVVKYEVFFILFSRMPGSVFQVG